MREKIGSNAKFAAHNKLEQSAEMAKAKLEDIKNKFATGQSIEVYWSPNPRARQVTRIKGEVIGRNEFCASVKQSNGRTTGIMFASLLTGKIKFAEVVE